MATRTTYDQKNIPGIFFCTFVVVPSSIRVVRSEKKETGIRTDTHQKITALTKF